MIYHLTYLDANGTPLLETTFDANGPLQALVRLATVPSLMPPPGTQSIKVETQEI